MREAQACPMQAHLTLTDTLRDTQHLPPEHRPRQLAGNGVHVNVQEMTSKSMVRLDEAGLIRATVIICVFQRPRVPHENMTRASCQFLVPTTQALRDTHPQPLAAGYGSKRFQLTHCRERAVKGRASGEVVLVLVAVAAVEILVVININIINNNSKLHVFTQGLGVE
jgi:hypothetical protein